MFNTVCIQHSSIFPAELKYHFNIQRKKEKKGFCNILRYIEIQYQYHTYI